MLKFILGRASSGKSYEVCRQIAECVKNGDRPVLIIPEQFSFESEKRILSLLGDRDAQKVKVLSFSRLCDEVENLIGGSAVGELSDSDKIILINTAMRQVRDRLKYFGKYSRSSGFAKMILNTIGEFSGNAVSVSDILEAAEGAGDGILSRKLYDTALIYAEYNELMSEKFTGYGDRLQKLYEALESFNYFSGKKVFIDSFGGFTGQQYRIIDRIFAQAKDVTVSFCDNPFETGSMGLFANIKKAKNRIICLAEKRGIKTAEDTVLESGKWVSPGLAAIEEYLCLTKTIGSVTNNELKICRAQTAYDEAQFVARNIRKIIREKGARYNDFVVIARNPSDYEQVVSTAFQKNGISLFMDKRLPLSGFPPAAAVKAAMELFSGFTTEKILRFHKCGVGFLSENELSMLENYAFVWNLDGNAWKSEWTMDPRGFDENKTTDDEAKASLKEINELRIKAISPINEFIKGFNGSVYDMAKAVVRLLQSAKGEFLKLSGEYKDLSKSALSDGIISAYSKVMKILDSLVNCLPERATQYDFSEAFKNCVEIESLGVIPQMVDEVTFGAADRIQPARPSYVFIMGANQGVFPRSPEAHGVFAVSEIGKLIELGIGIPDCSVYSAIDEALLVYNCVCCADKGVFISFNQNSGGEASHFVKKLINRFSVEVQNEPNVLSRENLPETAEDTFSRLCRSEHEKTDYITMRAALSGQEEYNARLNSISHSFNRPGFNIPRELALKLVGNKIALSPSRFDTYSKCAFMYFCKYALSVKSLEPVSFSAMQTGTVIHYVLEHFIEWASDDIGNLKKDEIHLSVEKFVNEYLDGIKGYRDVENEHLKLMVSNITDTLKYLCERLVSEFAQSDFRPQKCELVIGKKGDMPPLEILVDEDVSVSVSGAVDRLDRYGGYIRIIDYKTGKRDFKLPDILVGQNMQMLIYLYAVCQNEDTGGMPAGIFYMRAALPEDGKASSRRMNGFMPEDEMLINAMDKSGSGEFIPQSNPKARRQGVKAEDFDDIFEFLELKLKQAGRDIASGRFDANPIDGRDKKACEYCEFSSICRIEKEKPPRVDNLSKDEVMEEIKRQVSENGV